MSESGDEIPSEQELLLLLEDARGRLRTVIWALHGMHQDMSAVSGEDLADLEQLVTETLDHSVSPACELLSRMFGAGSGEAVTTH